MARRAEWAAAGVPTEAFSWMPTVVELDAARERLRRL